MKEVRAISPSFGGMIKYLRNKRGLSLRQVREASGISESYINRIETGDRQSPSYPIIEKLALALGVEPADLLEVGSQKNNGQVISVEQLLFSSTFTVDGNKAYKAEEVELLLNLIDVVNGVTWEKETMLADIYEITQAVDEMKRVSQ